MEDKSTTEFLKEVKQFWRKFENRKNTIEMLTGKKSLEEGPEVDIHIESLRATLRKVQNWEAPAQFGKHGFWFKNAHQSMTDWFFNWVKTK